jgi:acetyl-CoA carboxylase biotin carboxyl carrier protein
MDREKKFSWLERVEDLIQVLEGSSISELELSEAGMEIIIRRQPGVVMVAAPQAQVAVAALAPSTGASAPRRSEGVAIVAPLTGVYYASSSPSTPPFVNVGDTVHVGQVVALIEAMKIFNEVQADVSGRVIAILARSGEVVQKGDPILRVEPL